MTPGTALSQTRSAISTYQAFVTVNPSWAEAAQRMRHDVFSTDFGVEFPSANSGLDRDQYDEFCEHLVIWHEETDTVAGTCRMLRPERAAAVGGRYSGHLFDLSRLAPIDSSLMEVSRLCVHPAHRNGAVVSGLWAGIVRHAMQSGSRWLGGCCSVPLADGGELAAVTWNTVSRKYLAPPSFEVRPRVPWRADATGTPARPMALPALLRGYLRLGAWVCGEPAHDAGFRTADLYVLLDLDRADGRYLRRYASFQSS
jgi:putative hemolysin